MVYAIVPTALWVIGNLIQLLRCHDFHFYPQHNIRLNNHLRVDAWLMLLIGVALMAYPSQILKAEVGRSQGSYAPGKLLEIRPSWKKSWNSEAPGKLLEFVLVLVLFFHDYCNFLLNLPSIKTYGLQLCF